MVVELLEKIRSRVQRPKETGNPDDGGDAAGSSGCFKRNKAKKKGDSAPQDNDTKARKCSCGVTTSLMRSGCSVTRCPDSVRSTLLHRSSSKIAPPC